MLLFLVKNAIGNKFFENVLKKHRIKPVRRFRVMWIILHIHDNKMVFLYNLFYCTLAKRVLILIPILWPKKAVFVFDNK